MKLKYVPEADVIMLVLSSAPLVDAVEEPGGVIGSYGDDGQPVTVELLNATARRLIESGELSITIQSGRATAESQQAETKQLSRR